MQELLLNHLLFTSIYCLICAKFILKRLSTRWWRWTVVFALIAFVGIGFGVCFGLRHQRQPTLMTAPFYFGASHGAAFLVVVTSRVLLFFRSIL